MHILVEPGIHTFQNGQQTITTAVSQDSGLGTVATEIMQGKKTFFERVKSLPITTALRGATKSIKNPLLKDKNMEKHGKTLASASKIHG